MDFNNHVKKYAVKNLSKIISKSENKTNIKKTYGFPIFILLLFKVQLFLY
jgi:hypothetical protein